MIALFLFFNKTRHRLLDKFTFSPHFKHVDIYTNDGTGWIGFRLTSDGLLYSKTGDITAGDLAIMMTKQPTAEAVIGAEIKWRAHFPWTVLTIPMCNEAARLISGVDIGFTWNPRHLYEKLLKYDHMRNYDVLFHWRRDDGNK